LGVYPHQAERLTAALELDGLAALVAATPANVFYVTGYGRPSQAVDPAAEFFAVFTRRGTALVVPAIEAPAVAGEPAEADHVVCYGAFVAGVGERDERARRVAAWVQDPAADPAEGLARALDALSIGRGRVGLDAEGAPEATRRRLAERLPTLSLVDGTAALARARAVKGPWEVECLARALGTAEEAVNEVLQMLKPGVGEREAATLYEAEVRKRGAEPFATRILMGERSALPAASPSGTALQPGDLVRLEVGCVVRGYRSAVARTAVMGEPTALQEARHAAILAGAEAAIDAIRHGVSAGLVFDAAIRAVSEAGLPGYRRDHVGHGIGLCAVESPWLAPSSPATLETGMVLRVETVYVASGWGGLGVADTVLVTPKEARVLNRSERGLIILD